MRSKLIVFFLVSLVVCNARAATWYMLLGVGNRESLHFFDRDTVTKQSGKVNIWIQFVNSENSPEPDGSFSNSSKYSFDCKKRTLQTLLQVTYDKNRNHMRTISIPGRANEVVPGTMGESMFNIICAADFPNLKSDDYMQIPNNDTYATAKRLFDIWQDAAPK